MYRFQEGNVAQSIKELVGTYWEQFKKTKSYLLGRFRKEKNWAYLVHVASSLCN